VVGQPLSVQPPSGPALNTAGAGNSGLAVLRNVLLYQLGWFAAVLLAAAGHACLAAGALVPLLAVHVFLCARPLAELRLLVVVGLVGLAWDSVVMATGWQRYDGGQLWPLLAPLWIVALWAQFATLLRVSLRWLRGRPLQAALLGAVGGPLAWAAGARMGALRLVDPVAALSLQAAGWAVLTPCLVWLGERGER
jgi:hypothetical protein